MRYQRAAELDFNDYLDEIISAKHLATRALLVATRPAIVARLQTYDLALPQHQVPALAAWDDPTKAALLACYNVGTIPLSGLKDAILAALQALAPINLQRCPYCMLNDPRTWDHYLPKDSYPEYSVYHPNLLYVCFGCNQRKGDNYDASSLLYCHPYFTVPEGEPMLHCSVAVNAGALLIDYYASGLGIHQSAGQIAQHHLQCLKLTSRFMAEAASLVSNLIGELRHHFPNGIDAGALAEVLRRRYAYAQAQLGGNAWDARLWHGLAFCAEFVDYANAQIIAAEAPNSNGFEVPAPPQ